MARLSFYEQVGIVIPGALFLAVLLVIVPGASAFLSPKDISLGEFGIFLLVAYAGGQAIAAAGNLVETMWWTIRGGMPSEWIVYDDARILNMPQKQLLLAKIKSTFSMDMTSIVGQSRESWGPVFRQIYRYAISESPSRMEVFNGNYGLNRGLSAALLALGALNLCVQPLHWSLSLALLGGGLVYGFRMNRFGVHFAREVYLVFLNAKTASPE